MPFRTPILLVVLMGATMGLQLVRDEQAPLQTDPSHLLYVRSPAAMARLALSYKSLLADLYWTRSVQHYGGTKLSTDPRKKYDLLYPLLDLTTSLDPRFNIAYHFGATFLAEPFPGGPGRPDQAIALLKKGLRAQPDHWEFAQAIGFVYYWWLADYRTASEWFRRASTMPRAPNWMAPLAAVTFAQGGSLDSSRMLWQQIARTAEQDWLRSAAQRGLRQLDAMDQLTALDRVASAYAERIGTPPTTWSDLARAGYLRGTPVDPVGVPYALTADGHVDLGLTSSLNPLPTQHRH
jgi:hypothetical protein